MPPTAIPDTPGTGTETEEEQTSEEPVSGINAPHPDDHDPADFFGDDEPTSEDSPSLMGDDEPDEEPVDEPVGEEKEKAPKPASGETIRGQTLSTDGEKAQVVDEDGGVKDLPVEEGPVDPLDAPTAGEKDAPSAEQEPQAAAASGEPPADDTAAAATKNGPRGYVVLREITLTKDYLDLFIKEQEEGKDARKVYVVLESKVESRNPQPVLMQTFKKHARRLGQPLRLAAIPLSMWKIRTLSVKPRVINDNIEIED